MKKRLEAKIVGRVQMVMYRDFATRNAKKLGLIGYVQNEHDGSVTVIAEGEEAALEEYLALLHKGSLLSRVETIAPAWRDASGEYKDFSIHY